MAIPNAKQIAAEVKKLKIMKPKVRQYTAFGDDNHAAIEAQLEVLENLLDNDDIYDRERDGDFTEHQRESASYALEWMEGDSSTPPSDDWQSLVR